MNYNNLIERVKDTNEKKKTITVKTYSGKWEDLTEEQKKDVQNG